MRIKDKVPVTILLQSPQIWRLFSLSSLLPIYLCFSLLTSKENGSQKSKLACSKTVLLLPSRFSRV